MGDREYFSAHVIQIKLQRKNFEQPKWKQVKPKIEITNAFFFFIAISFYSKACVGIMEPKLLIRCKMCGKKSDRKMSRMCLEV